MSAARCYVSVVGASQMASGRARRLRGNQIGNMRSLVYPDTSLQRELYLLIYFSNVCAVAEIPFCFFSSESELGTIFGISRKDTQCVPIFEVFSARSNNVRSRTQILFAFTLQVQRARSKHQPQRQARTDLSFDSWCR